MMEEETQQEGGDAKGGASCELDDADDGGRARRGAWTRASYPGCIQSCFAKVGLL
jgi:hypothetical protein